MGCALTGSPTRGFGGRRPAPSQDAASGLFRDAERAYQQHDYGRARQLYQALVATYPHSPLAEDASFRLAEMLYYQGDYAAAQQAFQEFLTQLPRSKFSPQAAYLQALSLSHVQRYAEARQILEQALAAAPAPGQQAPLLLGLAEISWAEGQRLRAIGELQAMLARPQLPEAARREARQRIIAIVTEQLTPAELEEVKKHWPLEFPTDYVLLHQAKEAWNRHEAVPAEAAAQAFLEKFPDRPEAAQMRAVLADIEQARTVNVDQDKIGVILPLSSPQRREWISEVGQNALQGIQVAFAREGFNPLKLEIRDSQANLSATSAIVEELATVQRVIAIVGPLFNETTESAAKQALRFHVPLITPGAPLLEVSADNPYVLRTALTNRLEARRLAEYAIGNLGLRRFAILYPNDAPGLELAETFHSRVAELGGEVIIRQAYAANQVDFTGPLRQLGGRTDEELKQMETAAESSSPPESLTSMRANNGRLAYEALYVPRSFERLQYLAPAMRLLNVTGITLLGESGWNQPDLLKRAGAFVEGAVFMDGFFAGAADQHVRDFVHSYQTMFNTTPDLMAAQSHDAMLMLLRVLKQRPQSRDAVRDKLRNIKDFRGATGWLSMLPSGDLERRLFALTVRRGRIVELH